MDRDPAVSRDEDLWTWRSQFSDATPIGEARPRQRSTCVGVVHKIRLVPRRQLEVTIEDGSGRLTGIFVGRSNLPGLELGAGLQFTGTVADGGDAGLLVRNPEWARVMEPYQ